MASTTRFTGRPRVVAWIVAVTAVGLTLMLIGISVSLRVTVSNAIQQSIAQETGEIRRFSTTALDPESGGAIATADRFVELYLARQQAEPSEIILGADAAGSVIGEQTGAEAPPFASIAPDLRARIMTAGSGGTETDPVHGPISWQNVPIHAQQGSGTIVDVVFHQPIEADTRGQLGLLALLALGSLAATGLVAWVVSGRILSHFDDYERAAAEAMDNPGLTFLPEAGGAEYVRLASATNTLLTHAEEAVESERQFSEDLAYELRTPLGIVHHSLEQPGHTSEQQAHTYARVRSEVARLRRLVDDLVVVNRADRADYVRPVPGVDVAAYIEAFCSAYAEGVLEQDGADVTVRAGELVPGARATIDEPRLARALDELVENAVAASAPGSEVVLNTEVSTRRDGTERVRIDVVDSGRGIPEEDRGRVTRPFQRASNDPEPGAGLGLAVADGLVRAMDGRLRLREGPDGVGTIARIELPLDPADEAIGTDETV